MVMRVLTAQRLFTGTGFLSDAGVLVSGDSIVALVRPGEAPEAAPIEDYGAALLAPGLVDAQVNGGGGVLVNAEPTPAALARLTRAHASCGTTALMATVITDRPSVRQAAADAVTAALSVGTPGLLGLHFEGPFLNPERRGVHEARWLCQPDEAALALMTRPLGGVTLVTLAPECVSQAALQTLLAAGVRVSVGHSAADPACLQRTFAAGATGFTHLFNATGPISARAPGPAAGALDSAGVTCGLIADGHHVDPLLIRLAWRLKGPDRLMLVSDAMPPAAGGAETFPLGERLVQVRAGRCTAPDGGLAGAAATLADGLRVCVDRAGVPLGDVLTMATATPAAFLGVAPRHGHLAAGSLADLVLLDPALRVLKTWSGGEPVAIP